MMHMAAIGLHYLSAATAADDLLEGTTGPDHASIDASAGASG
jgi:hypothetical protein